MKKSIGFGILAGAAAVAAVAAAVVVRKKQQKCDLTMDFSLFEKIKSQIVGFPKDEKPDIKQRLRWKWNAVTNVYHNTRHTIRNHLIWHKTMRNIRTYNSDEALCEVMITQLREFIRMEIRSGNAMRNGNLFDGNGFSKGVFLDSDETKTNTETITAEHVLAAKETIEILRRMQDSHHHDNKQREAVEKRYPEYNSLWTEYESGGGSIGGDLVPQGKGWAGAIDDRKGYFEFVNGTFELVESPDQAETDRLLAELAQYYEDLDSARKQAEIDQERDFDRLGELLKKYLHTWWD